MPIVCLLASLLNQMVPTVLILLMPRMTAWRKGDSQTLTIPVTVTDENGATDSQQIQVTVTGTNDAPVAGADVTANVAEGDYCDLRTTNSIVMPMATVLASVPTVCRLALP